MKPGDKVRRMWKPKYGQGEIIHILGETIVVKWTIDNKPQIMFEKIKYLKRVE